VKPRQAARIAAAGLLVMSILSPLAFFAIFTRLVDRTDVARTIANLTAHQGAFLRSAVLRDHVRRRSRGGVRALSVSAARP
jgi:hypothetical protein